MSKHTALPWKVVVEDIGDETFIYAPVGIKGVDGFDVVSYEGGFIPDSEWNLDVIKANAALIVRACNCHDELVEACKMLIHFVPDEWPMPLGWIQVVAQAQQAITKAEGGEG